MILRPRQQVFVDKCNLALEKHGNTIGVAPTGAGKTVMMSAVCAGKAPVLFLQHRDELIEQNITTFQSLNPKAKVDIFTSKRKKFPHDGYTFGMIQTLMRDSNMERMSPVNMICIDEAHHLAADGYQKVISFHREMNPKVKIFGVTATPARGDRKCLTPTINNVADEITMVELIQTGHLVKPRTFVIDCGLRDEIEEARKEAKRRKLQEFDPTQIEKIMDKEVVHQKVYEEWKKLASDRRTIIFCSTVRHANDVMEFFNLKGENVAIVTAQSSEGERKDILKRFDKGEIQILVNVAVLTEGFDSQPVSCVILLRPCSYKSTMIQMIGRGLRRVDMQRYPGILKDDCVVLDFGYSILTHGDINADVHLGKPKKEKTGDEDELDLDYKVCDKCGCQVPVASTECPICGYVFEDDQDSPDRPEKGKLENFVMTEVELLETSPFQWEEFFDGILMIANGFSAWVMCLYYANRWFSVGGIEDYEIDEESGEMKVKNRTLNVIGNTCDRFSCLAVADDFLRKNGDVSASKKSRQWLGLPPSDKQQKILNMDQASIFTTSRYRASCMMTWKFNEGKLRRLLEISFANKN